MSTCTDGYVISAQRELQSRNKLTLPTKRKLILDVLASNPEMLGKLLQVYEPRLKVYKNGNQFVIQDAFNKKVMEEVKRVVEEVNDELSENATDDERTIAFHEKGKLSVSKLVHQFIGTIPYLSDEFYKGTVKDSYTVDEKFPFLSSRLTLPILVDLYSKSPNIHIHSHEGLEMLIRMNMNKASLPTAHRKILHSLHQFLFGNADISYTDMYGNKQTAQSILKTIATHPDLSVKRRNLNYLTSLSNTIASINGESVLSMTNEDGVFDVDNDVMKEQKAKFNTNVANNLYKVAEGRVVDGKEVPGEIYLNPGIIDAFVKLNVQIRKAPPKTTSSSLLNNNPNGHLNIFEMKIVTRDKTVLEFTFALNGGEVRTIGDVKTVFNTPLAIVTHLGNNEEIQHYKNTKKLLEVFKATGIDKNTVDGKIIQDYVTNEYNVRNSNQGVWTQLWSVAVNNLLALAATNDVRRYHDAFNVGSAAANTNFGSVKRAIDNRFSGTSTDLSARNLKITLARTFGPVAISKGMNTFLTSPLMNFSENSKLIRQIVASRNKAATSMQRDVNNNNVNKLTTATNIEFIKKTISQIRDLVSGKTNFESVFSRDIFIGRNVYGLLNPRARISKITRFSGNKDAKGIGKPLGNMNESEINYVIFKNYAQTLKKYWNPSTLESKVVRLYTSVLSDKPTFIGTDIELQYNALPRKGDKLDISFGSPLVQEFIRNDIAYKTSMRIEFIESWKKSGILPVELFAASDAEILARIEKLVQDGTLDKLIKLKPTNNLVLNKHYYADKDKVFRVKPLFLATMRESINPDTTKMHRKLLAYSALNHNALINQGVTIDAAYDKFLEDAKFTLSLDTQKNPLWKNGVRLNDLFEHEGFLLKRDSNGELIVKDFDVELAEIGLSHIHPIIQSQFFTWNTLSPSINRMLYGDLFQYKGETYNEMMSDRLKRSVQSVAPYKRLSVDEHQHTSGNLYVPRESDTLLIEDISFKNIPILGNGEMGKLDILDGGSLTFPLAEYMYQQSYGAEHGENPKASLKFIYGDTDIHTAHNTLYKYAVHTLTPQVIRNGSESVDVLMKLFMGTHQFNRDVQVQFRAFGQQFKRPDGMDTYGPNETLWHIYQDLLAFNNTLVDEEGKRVQQNPFIQLANIISINQNPATGKFDLKTKFVSQIVFKSSNKTGQSNFHSWDVLKAKYAAAGNGHLDLTLDKDNNPTIAPYKVIDNTKLGIQLDATHDPENTTVALYSQGITNSILEGRLMGVSKEMLHSLSQLTKKNKDKIKAIFDNPTSENIEDFQSMRLADLPVGKLVFNPDLDTQKEQFDSISDNNVKRKLYIRSILLKSLESQDITNTTYQQVLDNTFSANDPQIEGKLTAALNSHLNKQLISFSIPGGNYVLSPTSTLLHVYDAVDKQGNSIVITKDRTSTFGVNPVHLDETGKVGKGRELAWKGYTKNGVSIMERKPDGSFANPIYGNLVKTFKLYKDNQTPENKTAWLTAKNALNKELANGYETQPAEVIMAYPYKQKFGISRGMQPSDVTEEFFLRQILTKRIKLQDVQMQMLTNLNLQDILSDINAEYLSDEELDNMLDLATLQANIELLDTSGKFLAEATEKAQQKKASFDRSLEILVGRIPSTGPQSAVIAKIVGFIDSSSNAIFIPAELMMIQGADLDIDKAVVISRNFDKNGIEHQPVVGMNGVDYENSSFEGIQNYHTDQLFALYNNPVNGMATNVPVSMEELKQLKDEKGDVGRKNHPMLPHSITTQKVLTSEGKSMVGIFANGLKTYGLTFFAYRNWNKNNAKQREVRPLQITVGDKKLTINEIANIEPDAVQSQAWEMYSGLVNAATDNAKELILGAIGANLQTGNIINVLTMYGVPTRQLFDWLSQDFNKEVLKEVAHATDIDNHNKEKNTYFLTFEAAIEKVVKRMSSEEKLANKTQIAELLEISAKATEFATLAKLLGINRGLPNTPFKKYTFTKGLENYINEKISKTPLKQRFSLEQFLNEQKYQQDWIELYDSQLKSGVNILFVMQQNPHILEYLKAKSVSDNIIKGEVRKYTLTERILDDIVAKSNNLFKTPNEEEYNHVLRYVTELGTYQYLKDRYNGKPLKVFDTVDLEFDFAHPVHGLQYINRFIAYFPEFIENVKSYTEGLKQNRFFQKLEKSTDEKGTYLSIEGIEDLTQGEIDDLQFHLNHTHVTEVKLDEKGKQKISYEDFKGLLFTYSIIIGKGKVSRSSFFELFESEIKGRMGYNHFMQENTIDVKDAHSNESLLSGLTRFLPNGIKFITGNYKNQLTYEARGTNPPNIIQLFFESKPTMYVLNKDTNTYEMVKPLYKTVGISANDTNQKTHVGSGELYIQINKSEDVREAIIPRADGSRNMINLQPPIGNGEQDARLHSNIGTFKHTRSREAGKPNSILERRKLGGLDIKVGGQLLDNLLSVLSKKYPHISHSVLSAEEIVEQFGEQFRYSPAFTDGNQVVVNSNEVTMDAPMHEFAHIHLAILKEQNPELYQRAIELALQDNSEIANLIREKYADKGSAEVGEEIFVTLVGLYGTKQLLLKYPMANQSWLQSLVATIREFFAAMREHFNFVSDATMDTLDLQTASLGDFVSAISSDMLSGDLGKNLSKLDKEYIQERRNFVQNSEIDDALNLLVNEKKVDSKSYTQFKDNVDDLRDYIDNKLNRGKKYPFSFDSYLNKVGDLLMGDWNNKYCNIYTLAEFARATSITGMEGSKSVRKAPMALNTTNKNIVVRTQIVNGKVECQLYDLNNISGNYPVKNGTSIAGNYVTKTKAQQKGVKYDATQQNVNSLRMGLIAIETNKANDNFRFGNLLTVVTNDGNTIETGGSSVEEAIANWQALTKIEEIGIPKSLSDVINGVKIDDDSLRVSYTSLYQAMLPAMLEFDKDNKSKKHRMQHQELNELFKVTNRTQEQEEELLKKLMARQNFIVANNSHKSPSGRREFDLLSKLILQEEKIRDIHRINQDTTVSQIQSLTNSIGGTGIGIIEFIGKKLLTAMGIVRRKILFEFKPKHDEKVKNLITHYRQENGAFTRFEDYTINDSRKFFHNLMEKKKVKNEAGEEVEVFTGKLVAEDSQEYNNLSTAEKEYLTYFNQQVEAGFKAMYPNKKFERGTIPLIKWRNETGAIGTLKEVFSNDKGTWAGVKAETTKWLDAQFNDSDYIYNKENVELDAEGNRKTVYALTVDQFNGFYDDNINRRDKLGFDSTGKILKDKQANEEFERDLSTVLQLFTANAYRKEEFDKVAPYINSVNYHLAMEKATFGTKHDTKGRMVQDYIDRLLYNKVSDKGDFHTINRWLSKLSSQSSGIMLGLNWPAALGNFVTGFATNYRQSVTNKITEFFDKDAKLFGPLEMAEAELLIGKDWELAGEMNKLYGFNSLDYQQLVSHNRRMSQTKKMAFSSENLFWINFIGDYYNRNTLFMAQMLKDGSYGAYQMVDGKLKYDEKLDKRFHTNGVFDPNKSLYKILKANLAKENGLNSDGSLALGYDQSIRDAMKYAADKIHGSYDNDFATNLNNYALGKLLLTFRKYYQNKMQQYIGGFRQGKLNEVEGRYITKVIDGIEVTQWQGTWQEGVFVSLYNVLTQIAAGQSGTIHKGQWQNMGLLAQDGVMLILITLLFNAWFDDDDEENINPLLKSARTSLYTTFSMAFDLTTYTKVLSEPSITFTYVDKQVNTFVNGVVLGKTGDRLKSLNELVKNTNPLYKGISQTANTVDYLQQGVLIDNP